MSRYFDKDIYNFEYQPKDINKLLCEKNYLVVGDFWGIQSFIFEGLTTKKAAKVLRAKSAYVQIIMEVVAKYICDSAKVGYKHILTTNAGKFEVLLPTDIDIIAIQQKLDEYFIKNFYGISGIGLAKIKVNKNEWQKDYKNFREQVAKEIEKIKLKKFDLINKKPILEDKKEIDNQSLCNICNVRKKEDEKDECKVCDSFIKLGERLANFEVSELVSIKKLSIDIFDDYDCDIVIDERLVSCVPTNDKKNILTFEEIAQNSCKDSDTGIKALGILKADVDGMGNFIKASDITDNFKNFDEFSNGLDSFFSLHVTEKLRKEYKNIYTVFAGGDDLFLVGAWDEAMNFSRVIREEFKKYVKDKLSISFGLAIAKPSTPISYLASYTEELLEKSKEIDEKKDAITIWSETVKWDRYLKIYKKLDKEFKSFELNTALLYRLLEFCNMSKNIHKDIKNTMWKSKLNYLFARNIGKEYHYMLEILDKNIEKYPKETKMFLSEFIYKRREG